MGRRILLALLLGSLAPPSALAIDAIFHGSPRIVVWKSVEAYDEGTSAMRQSPAEPGTLSKIRPLVACIVPSGTRVSVDRIHRSWLWVATVTEGESKGCQGVVSPRSFKTPGELEAAMRPPPPPPSPPKPRDVAAVILSPVDRAAAGSALSALKALQSAARAGITYQNFNIRLGDTKIAVDRAMEGLSHPTVRKAIARPMRYYEGVGPVWDGKRTDVVTMILSIYRDCPQVEALLRRPPLERNVYGVSTIFQCASDAIADVSALLGDTSRRER